MSSLKPLGLYRREARLIFYLNLDSTYDRRSCSSIAQTIFQFRDSLYLLGFHPRRSTDAFVVFAILNIPHIYIWMIY